MLSALSATVQVPLAGRAAKLPYMGETFKARMKRLRQRAGFKTHREAAAAIGCTRGTVAMWEAPSSAVKSVEEYLLPVARAYKVRPDYINSGKGEDGYPWSDAGSRVNEPALSPDETIRRLQNDVRALNMTLGSLIAVMTLHRPAEASALAQALRARTPPQYLAYGLIDELLTTLGVADEEARPAKARA